MTTKKRILFSTTSQFGYHTDTYMYCYFLDKSNYEIEYIGYDEGFPRLTIESVKVMYIPFSENILKRYYNYVKALNNVMKRNNYDVVFQIDSQFVTLIVRLINLNQKMVLDIRTGDLSNNWLLRKTRNALISLSSLFYHNVTCVSKGLSEKLHICKSKVTILPLGGILRSNICKSFESLNLLYVGTLDKRNIEETVYGVSLAMKLYPHLNLTYIIIGSGSLHSVNKLKYAIEHENLGEIVRFHGRKYHDELDFFFNTNNVGIVYVPQKKYYDMQPATKLYEYLLAGMPVIATRTYSNQLEVKEFSGILCNDNAISFCEAILELNNKHCNFNSALIQEYYAGSSWQDIVKNRLEIFFENMYAKTIC